MLANYSNKIKKDDDGKILFQHLIREVERGHGNKEDFVHSTIEYILSIENFDRIKSFLKTALTA